MDSFMERLNKRMKVQQGTAVREEDAGVETPVMESMPSDETKQEAPVKEAPAKESPRSAIEEKVLEAYLEKLVEERMKKNTETNSSPKQDTTVSGQGPMPNQFVNPMPGMYGGMYGAPQYMYGGFPQAVPTMYPGMIPVAATVPSYSSGASSDKAEKTLEALEAEVERMSSQLKEYAAYLRTIKEAETRSQALADRSMVAADKSMNATEKLGEILKGLDAVRVELETKIMEMEAGSQKPADLGPAVVDIINAVKDTKESVHLYEKNTGKALEDIKNAVSGLEPISDGLSGLREDLAEAKNGILEGTHKESVKTYRNVQAVVVDSAAKAVAELTEVHDRDSRKTTAAVIFSILAFLAATGVLALNILEKFF